MKQAKESTIIWILPLQEWEHGLFVALVVVVVVVNMLIVQYYYIYYYIISCSTISPKKILVVPKINPIQFFSTNPTASLRKQHQSTWRWRSMQTLTLSFHFMIKIKTQQTNWSPKIFHLPLFQTKKRNQQQGPTQSHPFFSATCFHLHQSQLPQQLAMTTQKLQPPKSASQLQDLLNHPPLQQVKLSQQTWHSPSHGSATTFPWQRKRQVFSRRNSPGICNLHFHCMDNWPFPLFAPSFTDIKISSSCPLICKPLIHPYTEMSPQKQQHHYFTQAKNPGPTHLLHTPTNTFQHLC